MFKITNAAQLDPSVAKARPDQLVLEDDPAFVPGFGFDNIPSDFLQFDLGNPRMRHMSDTASLQTTQSQQQLSQQFGLQLPSSSSGGGGLPFPGIDSGSHGPRPSSLLAREDEDFLLPEIDIGLDADGNFIEIDAPAQGVPGSAGRSILQSDSVRGGQGGTPGIGGQVRLASLARRLHHHLLIHTGPHCA